MIGRGYTFFYDADDFPHSLNISRSNDIFGFSFRQVRPKYINKKKVSKGDIENIVPKRVLDRCTGRFPVAQIGNHHRF